MDTFLPIILGSDENAYGTVRLFREFSSVRPLLLCTRRLTPTRDSSLFDIECIPDFDSPAVFSSTLGKILAEKKKNHEHLLVVSCSDYYTALLAECFPAFGDLIDNPCPSLSLLSRTDTKDKFYALCEECGLDYPKTVVVPPEDREAAILDLPFAFPIVVKPENSNATEYLHCSFEGKKKVFFFDCAEAYLSMVRHMNASGYRGKLILQEFIPGGDGCMRTVNSYSDKNGKVRMIVAGQPVLEEYAPKTLGNYAAIISRKERELCEKLKGFLEQIGYTGFANFDLKCDPRSGRIVLFELNPRLGRSSYFCRAAGYNFMKCMTENTLNGIEENGLEKNGIEEGCVFGETEALWTSVPKGILMRYVKDPALKDEVRAFYRKGNVTRTLFNKEDRNLKRFLRIEKYFLTQYRNYRNYWFDRTEGR